MNDTNADPSNTYDAVIASMHKCGVTVPLSSRLTVSVKALSFSFFFDAFGRQVRHRVGPNLGAGDDEPGQFVVNAPLTPSSISDGQASCRLGRGA